MIRIELIRYTLRAADSLRDTSAPPDIEALAAALDSGRAEVVSALRALADEHCLVLLPDGQSIWMAHPFSGIATDCVASVGNRRWFANCVWDGLGVEWYATRLDRNWQRADSATAAALFARHNLTGEFWSLG